MAEISSQIRLGQSRIFRRLLIKRREQGTGLFEDEWFDVSEDVKKWGKIRATIDAIRLNKFNFSPLVITLDNSSGRYNPEDNEASYWYGYLHQPRTLVKVETGFVHQTLGADGIWVNSYYGENAIFDESEFDTGAEWDGELSAFYGVISGDISLSDKDEVTLNIAPVTQIFREYPASNLRGLDNSITASRFMTLLRDQTDGAGSFVFRPFFDDTTSNWDISTTTVTYSNLNTNTAKDIRNMTVWDAIERLAEAENHVAYVSNTGVFKFKPRDANTSTAAFTFYGGSGLNNIPQPITIKSIQSYARKMSKFYSRVRVKHTDLDTTTSFEIQEATLTVASSSISWNLGQKTLDVENFWIPTSTVAQTIALSLFNDYSAVKDEIEFTTTFVPHLDILDRIAITYDNSPVASENLWDVNDWTADGTSTANDLIWSPDVGNAINLSNDEFKFQSMEIDLDKFECKFSAREI